LKGRSLLAIKDYIDKSLRGPSRVHSGHDMDIGRGRIDQGLAAFCTVQPYPDGRPLDGEEFRIGEQDQRSGVSDQPAGPYTQLKTSRPYMVIGSLAAPRTMAAASGHARR
jgi:hypothetical protein